MARHQRRLLCCSLAALAACGGSGGGTGPPPGGQVLGSIVVASATMNLGAGQRQTITVTALDDRGATIAGASGYVFTSSDNTVALVASSGRVTALTAGTATITVLLSLNGVTKTATVTVIVTGTLPLTAIVAAGTLSNDFAPDLVALRRTGVVTFTFGVTQHNVQFGNTSGAPQDIPNSQSRTVDRTFNNAGTFQYICSLHSGMSGTIVVP